MGKDLDEFVEQVRIYDTHEHMPREEEWAGEKPDILREVFDEHYVRTDLIVAGASQEAADELMNVQNREIQARFAGVAETWAFAQCTGFGEATKLIASRFFGITQITGETLAAAQERLPAQWPPGDRLRILREEARLDHIQTDDLRMAATPDSSAPDFFLYDLSLWKFCSGDFMGGDWLEATGVEVRNLDSLREALENAFERYGPSAIAVKSQHAYDRTLAWREVEDDEAGPLLEKVLTGAELNPGERNALGDWCTARGVELSIRYNLPFKIHTGALGRHSYMAVDHVRPGQMCGLLKRYPEARFVLMHIGYPYQNELLALAKHYPNVYVDLCWAWTLNPMVTSMFVRRFIHSVPCNKLFAFGGDTFRPRAAATYALQARKWLTRTLQEEVEAGDLNEAQAIQLAERVLQKNQEACFDLAGTRTAILDRLAVEV